jgi:FkbM family methyltransferase
MLNFIRKRIPGAWKAGLKRRIFAFQDMTSRLANLKRAGFSPSVVLDVGAFDGEWTRAANENWPTVKLIIIEPLPEKRAILETLAARLPAAKVFSCASGSTSSEVSFRVAETNSQITASGGKTEELIRVPCLTLDEIVEQSGYGFPELIKLDTQGHELEILKGAREVMKKLEVLLLEVSILRIGEVPIFREVDRFLEAEGFRLYDIIPQYYRPLDGALWQVDAFYVNESSPLVASREWN